MVFCNYTLYKGKIYETYFDKDSLKIRFFIDGVEASDEIVYELNQKYNKKPNDEIKLFGENKLIAAIVGINILLGVGFAAINTDFDSPQIDRTPQVEYYEEYEEEYTEDSDYHFTEESNEFYDTLLEASGDNREYVEMMEEPIRDFSEYLLYDDLLNTIYSLRVTTQGEDSFDTDDTLGYFDKFSNEIAIRDTVPEYDKDMVIRHEMFHYLSRSGLSDGNGIFDGYIGYALNEGVTQILTNEYDYEDSTYAVNVCYGKALIELVGEDVMAKAYFQNDLDYLINNISQYVSEDEAYSMIKNMDLAIANHESYVYSGDEEDIINYENNAQEFWRIYEEAYYNKNDKVVNEDLLLRYYKVGTTFIDDINGLDNIKYLTVDKVYFNEDRKGNDDITVYYYCDDEVYCDTFSELDRFDYVNKKSGTTL